MKAVAASLLGWCLAGCALVSAQTATKSPTVDGSKWEDPPPNTQLTFTVPVGGASFDVVTNTFLSDDDFSTNIVVTSSQNAWIGILVGTSMIGGTAIIGLDPNDSANQALNLASVGLYSLADKSGLTQRDCVPLVNGLQQNGILDATFSVVGGKSILNFTITSSASAGFPLVGDEPGSSITVAFVGGVSQTLTYHDAYTFRNAVFATITGSAVSTSAVQIPLGQVLAAHIVMMIISWIFILPLGGAIALARVRRGPKASGAWFKYHRGLQMSGVAIGFGGWFAGILQVQQIGTPHLSKGHHVIGYFIGIFALVQIVNGLMRPHAPEKGEQPTRPRARWFLSHRVLACILLLGGLTNCIIGAGVTQDLTGEESIIVFYGNTSGILMKTFFDLTLGLGIVAYLFLFVATFADRCRRRREGADSDASSGSGGYPEKQKNGGNNMNLSPNGDNTSAVGLWQTPSSSGGDSSMMSQYGGGMGAMGGGMGAMGGRMGGGMEPPPRAFSPPLPPVPPMKGPGMYGGGNDFGGGGSTYGGNMGGYQQTRTPAPNAGMQQPPPRAPTPSSASASGYPAVPARTMLQSPGGAYGQMPPLPPVPPMPPKPVPPPPMGFDPSQGGYGGNHSQADYGSPANRLSSYVPPPLRGQKSYANYN